MSNEWREGLIVIRGLQEVKQIASDERFVIAHRTAGSDSGEVFLKVRRIAEQVDVLAILLADIAHMTRHF